MDKINWCKKQKNGIVLTDRNQNLCDEYLRKSENALKAVKALNGNKEWQIS